MELKVWVEGIQRIVCGVGDTTTCQDVVFALAHATGKTGRFTLIERWRNNERLLAPSELPLKILMKWGERSNDVQFILQWSPLESPTPTPTSSLTSSSITPTNPPLLKSSTSGKQFQQTPQIIPPLPDVTLNEFNSQHQSHLLNKSNNSSSSPSSSSPAGNKSTLTNKKQFEQYFNNSASLSKNPNTPASIINGSNNWPVIDNNNSLTKNKDKSLNPNLPLPAPPPYRQPPNPSLATNLKPTSSSNHKELPPPYREPPNPSSLLFRNNNSCSSPVSSLNSYPGSIISGSGSSSSQQQNHSNNSNSNGSSSNSSSTTASTILNFSKNFTPNNSSSKLSNNSSNSSPNSTLLPPSLTSTTNPVLDGNNTGESSCNSNSNGTMLMMTDDVEALRKNNNKDFNLKNGENSFPASNSTICNGISSSTTTINSNSIPNTNNNIHHNPMYHDLVKLINLQREKLTTQQAELTQYDAEIMYWEGKAKEQQKQMDFITKEINRLESLNSTHESQLLSLSHIETENELLQLESEKLRKELSSLKSQYNQCEGDLKSYKSKIKLLSNEVSSTQSLVLSREEERKTQEAAIMTEIERLKQELEVARVETESVGDLCGSLEAEVHSIEQSLADKKKTMEVLVNAMKEANLQSLAIHSTTTTTAVPASSSTTPTSMTTNDDGAGGDNSQSNENNTATHHRSGSTRRMIGSPRQLENAAPTSKNPHGVWV